MAENELLLSLLPLFTETTMRQRGCCGLGSRTIGEVRSGTVAFAANEMNVTPDTRDYSKAIPPRIFVLMPFAAEYDAVHAAIKAAADAVGANARRVDEQIHDSLILERIYNQIRLADLIIADMTWS